MKATNLRLVSLSFLYLVLTYAQAQDGGQVTVTAERVQSAVTELERLAQNEIQTGAVPGLAIAVVFQDEVVFAKGFGVRDTKTNEPVNAGTVFQLASVSKPVGSTVIASLVGEGIISWDSHIADLDPSFAMYDPWVTREVTLRDMYSHRSGLPFEAGEELENLGFSRKQILHRLRYQRPDSSFRSSYAYTNYGLTAAAVAAAKAEGKTWAELSAERLYQPLGMDSTSSRFADFMARPNKALGHVLREGEWVHERQREPDAQSPAGGASSSVSDMAKWLRLHLGSGRFGDSQIIPEEALAETYQLQILRDFSSSGLPEFYGLGWNVRYDAQGLLRLDHSGAFRLGAGTTVNLVPAEGLGIVVLTNSSPTGVAEGLAATFIDLALYGEPKQAWLEIFKGAFGQMMLAGNLSAAYATPPASPTPALSNDAYLGTYSNNFFGDMAVVERDGGLAIVQGPKEMTFPMTHFDRDTFTYVTQGETAVGTAGIFFHLGADDHATSVTVENLDIDGQGTFTRVNGEAADIAQ